MYSHIHDCIKTLRLTILSIIKKVLNSICLHHDTAALMQLGEMEFGVRGAAAAIHDCVCCMVRASKTIRLVSLISLLLCTKTN